MGIGGRDFFFAHPSDAVRALALAYPHLPGDLAARAKRRAREELAGCVRAEALPAGRGRRREPDAVPPHDLSWGHPPALAGAQPPPRGLALRRADRRLGGGPLPVAAHPGAVTGLRGRRAG